MTGHKVAWADEEIEVTSPKLGSSTSATTSRRIRHRRSRGGSGANFCAGPPKVVTATNAPIAGTWSDSWQRAQECPAFAPAEASSPPFAVQDLLVDAELCTKVSTSLEECNAAECHRIMMLLETNYRQLSLSKSGCKLVQKALECKNVPAADKDVIIAELKDHVLQLYESPHANHVLARAIEALPVPKIGFIVTAFAGKGVAVSKHRYGCRVICRLLEHCTEDVIWALLDEIIGEAVALARHAYGNFVLKSVLSHMSDERRSAVVRQLLPDLPSHAMHRTGSLVVQRVFDDCSVEMQSLAIGALQQGEGERSLLEIACSHYGSYVLEQLADLRQRESKMCAIESTLISNQERLKESEHGLKVAIAFGLARPAQLEAES